MKIYGLKVLEKMEVFGFQREAGDIIGVSLDQSSLDSNAKAYFLAPEKFKVVEMEAVEKE